MSIQIPLYLWKRRQIKVCVCVCVRPCMYVLMHMFMCVAGVHMKIKGQPLESL